MSEQNGQPPQKRRDTQRVQTRRVRHVRHLARSYTEEAVDKLWELMHGAKSEKIQHDAATSMLNLAWPNNKSEDDPTDKPKLTIHDLTQEQLDSIVRSYYEEHGEGESGENESNEDQGDG